jgi:ATP-dependent RNA helicase DDX19/DBP5
MFLADIYSLLTIGQSIIFVGTKAEADTVHQTLSSAGFTCSVLHGAVEAAHRDATMEAFRKGESNVLITTNVLARGVDVDSVVSGGNVDAFPLLIHCLFLVWLVGLRSTNDVHNVECGCVL